MACGSCYEHRKYMTTDLEHTSSIPSPVRPRLDFDYDVATQCYNFPMDTPPLCTPHCEATAFPLPARTRRAMSNGTNGNHVFQRQPRTVYALYFDSAKPFACQQ